MTVFWIVAVVIMATGLLMLAPPMLRPREGVEEDLNARNVSIAKERLAELEAEKAAGTLNEEEFEQAKAELEGNLIDDLRDGDSAVFDHAPSKWTLAAVLVVVPLAAGVLYYNLGTPGMAGLSLAESNRQPQADDPHGSGSGQAAKLTMAEMLVKLEQKLEQNPDNAEGWFVLGRSHMSEKNYAKAAWALEKAHKLLGDHPTVLVGLADALAMKAGGKVTGRSQELLKKALQINPKDTTALWLMGIAMEDQAKYKEAIGYWQRILDEKSEDTNTTAQLRSLIAEAKKKGGLADADIAVPAQKKPVADAGGGEISVSVSLDDTLKQQASPKETLFIMAMAIDGPPMPLAVARLKVSDLPVEVKLNDAMAMMPELQLSKFAKVRVQARIAKSGKPTAQSGDLESEPVEAASSGSNSVKLVINRLVP